MRKNIKLPAPQLSQLKEVNVNLDMTGKHYMELATSEGKLPEEVILSIVKDLTEEDANKLTMAELRYIFMLIKINSLENKYTATVKCTIPKKDGKKCGCENNYAIFLSDNDLNQTPKNYKIPEIEFITDEKQKKYKVIPPTVDMEIALYDWFLTQKGISPDKIVKDSESTILYTFMRAVMHLTDDKGNRIVQNVEDFDNVIHFMEQNKYQTIMSLNKAVTEVNSFGVQNKVYQFKCKECGGNLIFQLPLLYGLTS